MANHHRYWKLTKQGWKCNACDPEQRCNWQERGWIRRDVGRARFPRIAVMTRQFLTIPAASATAERVFSFAGLTLSDLRKSLLEVR